MKLQGQGRASLPVKHVLAGIELALADSFCCGDVCWRFGIQRCLVRSRCGCSKSDGRCLSICALASRVMFLDVIALLVGRHDSRMLLLASLLPLPLELVTVTGIRCLEAATRSR